MGALVIEETLKYPLEGAPEEMPEEVERLISEPLPWVDLVELSKDGVSAL